MAQNDQLIKGVGLGLGAAILIPLIASALAPVVIPLARSALKAGVRVYEKGRETIEMIGETVEDVVAEVQDEMVEAKEAAMADIVDDESASESPR